MPLAWVDEISGVEPAINFLQGNGYTSQIWPHEGVEKQFLAYLPLQGWLHIITQYILGFSIYMVRLPYAIYLLLGALFLYKALKKTHVNTLVSLFIVILVLNEKSLFETTRGIRVEPITFLLLSISVYGFSSKKIPLVALASSLMIVLHPYVWPAAGVFLFACFYFWNKTTKHPILRFIKPNILWLMPVSILVFFLFFIHFDIELLYSQFVNQAERHTSFGGISSRFYNHFIRRFWPYYITQPYVPLLVYFALGYSIYKAVKRKWNPAVIALLLTHVVWFAILGPMHRYDSVLVFLSLFAVLPLLSSIRLPQQKIIYTLIALLLFGISCVDVASRQLMATVQRTERSPEKFLTWLNTNIDKNPSIISGHEIAYYAAVPNDNIDFFLFNTTPYRFDFDTYQNLYLISEKTWPNHEVVSKYAVQNTVSWDWIKNSGTHTYKNLYLLKAKSVQDYNHALRKTKSANTAERSKFTYQ